MKELTANTVESSELVEQTFKFWFADNEHIRSPFPLYIQPMLKENATEIFFKWAEGLNAKAKDEVNDTIVGEKFEEIIFEEATKLVKTEDERITILYPFLPRLDDIIKGSQDGKNEEEENTVVGRSLTKEGDSSYMKVVLEKTDTNARWETKFELPA